MAWFKVTVRSTNEFTYEVEADSISDVHNKFDDNDGTALQEWDCVDEHFSDEEVVSVTEFTKPPVQHGQRRRKPGR